PPRRQARTAAAVRQFPRLTRRASRAATRGALLMATTPRVLLLLAIGSLAAVAAAAEDPWQWLEEIEGERALAWARQQNERSLPVLERDPRFAAMHSEALEILTSKARIAYGSIHNGVVYNFWQDDEHVRGLWRRADVASYRAGKPKWEVLIDFDALAREEKENWVHGDINCLSPEYRHCMVEMSYGGKD